MFGMFLVASLQVLIVGIIFGAGLPAIFAYGVKTLSWGADGTVMAGKSPRQGKIIAYLCFAVVLTVIMFGIVIIVSSGFGYLVSLQHGFPTWTRKH